MAVVSSLCLARLSPQLSETEQSLGQQLKAMESSLQLATGEREEQLRLQEALRVSVCVVAGGAAPPPGGPQGECVCSSGWSSSASRRPSG